MKNLLTFPKGCEKPSSEICQQILASLLTVSGLYPEKNRHVVMDANLGYYTARFLGRFGPDMVKEWEIIPLKMVGV